MDKSRLTYEDLVYNPLFRTFSRAEIESFLADFNYNLRHYQKEELLFVQGDPCTRISIIISGSIEVQKIDPSGKMLLVMDITSNEVIGASVIFSGHTQHQMTAMALSPVTLMELTKKDILRLCQMNENFLEAFLESITSRAYQLTQRLRETTLKTLREKICEYLYAYHSGRGSLVVDIPFTKKYWAETLGVQRPSLSRELANLEKDGLIRVEGNTIIITDLLEVRRVALKA